MIGQLLHRTSLPEFLKLLAAFGEVHGPTMTTDGVPVFRRIGSPADIRFNYCRTLIPPKKYLLPPRETVLTFSPDAGYRQPGTPVPEIVLFGLHRCDLQGIAYLDSIFLGDRPDPLYRAKREATTIIGLSCEPDDHCFCAASAAGDAAGCDLYMQQTGEGFLISAWTTRGEAILISLDRLLEPVEKEPVPEKSGGRMEVISLAAASGARYENSPLWDEFAQRCLSCGACSLCCPTCYCFDVAELALLEGDGAARTRQWDNCLFKAHGQVAGGFSFRKTRRERFVYRYQHKFLGIGPTRGTASCVGCGRCREVCPVGIDMLDLFQEQVS